MFYLQTLILENERLQSDVDRLKFDNSQLVLKCKHAAEYKADIVVRDYFTYDKRLLK